LGGCVLLRYPFISDENIIFDLGILFTPTFSGTELGRKTRAGYTAEPA
jgi:hypothetical protein